MSMRVRLFPAMIVAVMAAGCSPAPEDHADAAVHDRAKNMSARSERKDKMQAAKAPATSSASTKGIPRPSIVGQNDAALPPDTHNGTADMEPSPHPQDLPPIATLPDPPPFPDEVTRFMVERDGCDHFRGEEPYDPERRAYLEESIAELCTGTDAKLTDLRQRYAHDPDVIAALGGYENRIEGGSSD